MHGATPLHVAAFNRDPEVLALLLDRGADIEAVTDTGATPCDLARLAQRLTDETILNRLCAAST